MEIKAVIGSLFGDEGKGNTVQWLCKDAFERGLNPIVVRFSGGPQAGHTVSDGNITHICSSYGSGVLLGVPTIIYDSQGSCSKFNHAYFDPIAADNERIKYLQESIEAYPDKKPFVPNIIVSENVRIITPYDMFHDKMDKQLMADGTCGSGQWACHKRYENSPASMKKFPDNPEDYIKKVREYYGYSKNTDAEDLFVNTFKNGCFTMKHNEEIKEMIEGMPDCSIILESSQGLLLDADKGFYPHVTSTSVGVESTFDFIKRILNANPCDCKYYFVMRTYLTRHGNGYTPKPFPETLENVYKLHNPEQETNKDNFYQGVFKYGLHETSLISKAYNRHLLDILQKKYDLKYNLVVTHFDNLQYFKTPKYCVITDQNEPCKIENDNYSQILRIFIKATGVDFETVFIGKSQKSNFENVTWILK